MTQLLANLRVLDLTRYIAGPLATALLADFGADVIRIEPPEGAEDRWTLPVSDTQKSGAGFLHSGRNKRAMTLNLASENGRAVFAKLASTADIVVTNLSARASQDLGLQYEQLKELKKDVIFLQLTAFGSGGPYADRVGFDPIAQVMSGLIAMSGEPSTPSRGVAAWVDTCTALLGAFGAIAALRHRDLTGHGQKVEANLFQTALLVGNYYLIEQHLIGRNRQPQGNRGHSGAPADLIRTQDGWIYLAVIGNSMFKRFARLVGQPQLIDDPRFQSDDSRAENGAVLSEIAQGWALEFTNQQAASALEKAKLPVGELLSLQDILDNKDIMGHFFQQLDVPGFDRPVPYVKTPVTLSETPGSIRAPPPELGKHTDTILKELGYVAEEIFALRASGAI